MKVVVKLITSQINHFIWKIMRENSSLRKESMYYKWMYICAYVNRYFKTIYIFSGVNKNVTQFIKVLLVKLINNTNQPKYGSNLIDLLESMFHLCMHGCTYPAGIVFVWSAKWLACYLFPYFSLWSLLSF